MNKKVLIGIIVAAVAIIAIVWIVVAVNSNNQNGGNGGVNSLNESTEITDTSVEGERVEGSSLVVTKLTESSSRGAKATVVNAGDTVQNHMIRATFYDAAGEEITTGTFTAAALEPGETKEATMLIVNDSWQDYTSVKYEVRESSSTPGQ